MEASSVNYCIKSSNLEVCHCCVQVSVLFFLLLSSLCGLTYKPASHTSLWVEMQLSVGVIPMEWLGHTLGNTLNFACKQMNHFTLTSASLSAPGVMSSPTLALESLSDFIKLKSLFCNSGRHLAIK